LLIFVKTCWQVEHCTVADSDGWKSRGFSWFHFALKS